MAEEPVEEQAAAVLPFGGCTRCDDPSHATFDCPLIGVGAVFRARHASECCLHRCLDPEGRTFVTDGPVQQRSKIIAVLDMGYMHACCAVRLLQPYDGLNLVGAPTLEQRVDAMDHDLPPTISAVRAILPALAMLPPSSMRALFPGD